jgi:23S rRNA (cytidine1920-2'-O)/16S rRNA (cytidine1409-2'-O)-methyltransferase
VEPATERRPGARNVRLDQRLVELGLEETRARAQAAIRAGLVWLGDRCLDKPGALVPADAELELRRRSPYVSRGGEKLAGALEDLALDPRGLCCADVGASTGGFTDCLLQRGARSVLAIDVGRGQLAQRLRDDPRVTAVERTNVRHYALPPGAPGFDLVTADLAFISLALVLPQLAALVRPGGRLLALVKPQFELDRRQVGRGGVVRDPELRAEAARRVAARAAEIGLVLRGECESRLAGPKGNRERFLLFERPAAA